MLYSWGANSHGQLGLKQICEQVENPTRISLDYKFNNIKQIACGGGHSLLLDDEGKLYSCGWNTKLQLGNKNDTHSLQRVWNLSGINFVNIACGWDFSCGVTDDKFLFVWGSNSHGQLGLPQQHFLENVKPTRLQVNACSVSMGLRHAAIINSKGEVWVTGCGKYGQLGLGSAILAIDRFEKVPKIGKISHIACGQNHTVSWSTEENALYAWGDNRHGQLLLNQMKYKRNFVPQKIDIDVRQGVKKLLSGWTNVLLWLEKGTIFTWGRNNLGQLGTDSPFDGKIVQINLPDGRQVQDVALGSEHTICLATDHTLWAWGWNEHANTGIKTETENVFLPTLVPIQLEENQIVTQIYSGGAHNFVVVKNTDDCDTKRNVEN